MSASGDGAGFAHVLRVQLLDLLGVLRRHRLDRALVQHPPELLAVPGVESHHTWGRGEVGRLGQIWLDPGSRSVGMDIPRSAPSSVIMRRDYGVRGLRDLASLTSVQHRLLHLFAHRGDVLAQVRVGKEE